MKRAERSSEEAQNTKQSICKNSSRQRKHEPFYRWSMGLNSMIFGRPAEVLQKFVSNSS